MLFTLFRILSTLLELYGWVLLIYCITTWVLPPDHPVRSILWRLAAPCMVPFEKLLDRFVKDYRIRSVLYMLSPILIMLALRQLLMLLWRVLL